MFINREEIGSKQWFRKRNSALYMDESKQEKMGR